MMDAIYFPSTQGDGHGASGSRLGGDGRDMREAALAVAEEVQGFGARVMGPVAPNSPLAGYARVREGEAALPAP